MDCDLLDLWASFSSRGVGDVGVSDLVVRSTASLQPKIEHANRSFEVERSRNLDKISSWGQFVNGDEKADFAGCADEEVAWSGLPLRPNSVEIRGIVIDEGIGLRNMVARFKTRGPRAKYTCFDQDKRQRRMTDYIAELWNHRSFHQLCTESLLLDV